LNIGNTNEIGVVILAGTTAPDWEGFFSDFQ